MKKYLTHCLLLFVFCGIGSQFLWAQQFMFLRNYVYQPELFNPALKGTGDLNKVWLTHRQRSTRGLLPDYGQSLIFSSPGIGELQKVGWGVNLFNEKLNLQHRLDANASLSFHVMDKQWYADELDEYPEAEFRLSLGALAGLTYMNRNLDDLHVAEEGDAVQTSTPQTVANLGIGIAANYNLPWLNVQAGAMASQLPELMTGQNSRYNGYVQQPHMLIHAGSLYEVNSQLWIGPQLLLKEYFGDNKTMRQGRLDLNVQAWLPYYRLWIGAGFRPPNAGFNGAVGFRIVDQDSTSNHRYFPQRWDLTANFDIPLNDVKLYGPTFEIGVAYSFGAIRQVKYDTIDTYLGPFWVHSGNLNSFLETGIKPENQPNKLYARSDNENNYVTLTYEYYDDIYQYDPEHTYGLNDLLKHVAVDVLGEAFHPTDPRDLSYPEHLGELESIEFHCSLKDDQFSALFLADSVILSENLTLSETFVYDEKDTNMYIPPSSRLNNLELAFLKMFKIKQTFLRYAHPCLTEPEIKPAEMNTIKVNTNNPNLESWQKNSIVLRFKKTKSQKLRRRQR